MSPVKACQYSAAINGEYYKALKRESIGRKLVVLVGPGLLTDHSNILCHCSHVIVTSMVERSGVITITCLFYYTSGRWIVLKPWHCFLSL